MTGQYIVQGIFALAGITSLLAALFNWNWFFTTRNAQSIVRNVGHNRARLFYGVLGIVLIGMATFFFIETQKALGL
ncbi:immunity 17 family protein [Bacteroides bouchesdurhonensis]|uniref:immunity 17 family protein n=1 Tax=Bacteroides bouchesdurhonensis TaxID=1841855 RepID=UPI00097F99D2|nr:immunity 17 family protein [Bacteroides bouchesdurhonensis]